MKYGNSRIIRKLVSVASTVEDELAEALARIEELEAEVRDLQSDVDTLEDKISDLDLELAEARHEVQYYQDEYYDPDYVLGLEDKISERGDTISELESELEHYTLIEEKTGKSPEELIEMFTDLRAVAAEFKCSECGARE